MAPGDSHKAAIQDDEDCNLFFEPGEACERSGLRVDLTCEAVCGQYIGAPGMAGNRKGVPGW